MSEKSHEELAEAHVLLMNNIKRVLSQRMEAIQVLAGEQWPGVMASAMAQVLGEFIAICAKDDAAYMTLVDATVDALKKAYPELKVLTDQAKAEALQDLEAGGTA